MGIVTTIVPVFLLIALGYFLKKRSILTAAGISSIKQLCVNIFLPVTAFDTLIRGTFTKSSIILMISMVIMLFLLWGIGRLYRPLFDEKVRGYIPFIMTTFEGGMFGWALVSILVGPQNLFLIIPMDILNGIFGFTFVAINLKILAGSKMTSREVVKSIVTNPLIIAVVLGFIGNFLHLAQIIDKSPCALLYAKCVTFLTTPLSPLILMCIGSGIVFDAHVLFKGLKAVLLRYITVAAVSTVFLLVMYKTNSLDKTLLLALLTYLSVPTSFLLPLYTDEKESVEFTSSVLSLEIFISLLIFSILTVLSNAGTFNALQ